jgi:hypothetical protein
MLMAKPKLANHLGTNSIFLSSVILYDAFNHPLNASIILILFKAITDLDKNLRAIPKTNSIVDESYKVSAKKFTAWGYAGSRYGKPSPTAELYLIRGKAALKTGITQVNDFLAQDVAKFKQQYQRSGLGLLNSTAPIALE